MPQKSPKRAHITPQCLKLRNLRHVLANVSIMVSAMPSLVSVSAPKGFLGMLVRSPSVTTVLQKTLKHVMLQLGCASVPGRALQNKFGAGSSVMSPCLVLSKAAHSVITAGTLHHWGQNWVAMKSNVNVIKTPSSLVRAANRVL